MTYGCHNREPLNDLALVQDGWIHSQGSRTPVMILIPDPMTKNCHYTTTADGQRDPKCLGCRHRQGGV